MIGTAIAVLTVGYYINRCIAGAHQRVGCRL